MIARRVRPVMVTVAVVAAVVIAAPASATTRDVLSGQQWGLAQVRAESAWRVSIGLGATIAIVDTGVDLDHPDLAGKLAPGATFTDCDRHGAPCGNGDWKGGKATGNGLDVHGTHVAGVAAAVTGNGIEIAGVAPDAKIMPIKVLDAGTGSFGDVAAGIRWAVDNGADVVNLSLGTAPGTQGLTYVGVFTEVTDAVSYAISRGVVVVAAAGNEVASVCSTPAWEDGVICVVATDRDERKAWYSNLGIKPEITVVAAPRGSALGCQHDIVSTVPVGTGFEACGHTDYDYFAGMSMAVPHVSGVVALLVAQGADPEQIERTLRSTGRTPGLGAGVFTPAYGWGIVDASAAVTATSGVAVNRSWLPTGLHGPFR